VIARYDRVASLLHWLIAVMILANWPLGLFGETIEERSGTSVVWLHKSIGLTVLALSMVRLGWRLLHRPPPLPPMSRWRAAAARFSHAGLYLLMIALPLTGWLRVSPGKYPLSWFGMFELPKWPIAQRTPEAALASQSHEVLAFALLALVAVHIAAALHHQFVLRDSLLRRMTWSTRAG
jgi:cytochrome b561